ncbi:MAG: MFS transporter [Legionella sp.]|uniref:MFS transporter n=1 Tax=Legionella sp. TaxID=459 RepID=UPI0039E38760
MTRLEKLSLLFLIPSASILATFISPELELIKSYFSLSSNQLSLVMTYYLMGYLVGQGVWGYLSTIFGCKISIRVGALIAIIGAFVLLHAYCYQNYNSFIRARMLMGFGSSAGLICGFIIIKENLSKEIQKKFITLVTMFFTAAIYTSIALSGHLLQYSSMNVVMGMFLFLGLCFYIFSLFIHSPAKLQTKQAIDNNHFDYKEIGSTVIYSLLLSITTIITYLYSFYAPLITSQWFSLSPQTYSTFSFFNLFFILMGNYLFTYLNRTLSEYSICISGLSMIILSNIALIIVDTLLHLTVSVFFICSYLMDFILGIIYPAATFMALEYGRSKALSSAIMNIIKLSLPIISIYFSSLFFQNKLYGFSLTIIICSSIFLLSSTLLKVIFQSKINRSLLDATIYKQ